MEERFIEIRLYYWLLKISAKFKYDIHVLDVIEAYSNLAHIDSRIIKSIFSNVRRQTSIIDTYKEEAVYVGRQLGISYRKLQKETGVSIPTQLKYNKYYEEHPDMYKGLTKKLSNKDFEAVYKFMKVIDTMKEL